MKARLVNAVILKVLVKTGAGGRIVSATFLEPVPPALVADTVIDAVPEVVGTPLTLPVTIS